MFKKILIANRGEIAVRILETCAKLGIPAATVHSEADREALHVKSSLESYLIGPPPVVRSYLNMEEILAVARLCEAEAIHPGYGFLAENPRFAEACAQAGIIFIGPNPNTISKMGIKVDAREIMTRAGIPVVPGTMTPLSTLEELQEAAKQLGYPVMVKASAGGGGIGMQIVNSETGLEKAFKTCSGRARANFADASVYLEKYIPQARHIEFQIFADTYGNVVHLNERECSIQRRHQKVIEESPSPLMDKELRQEMGAVAVRAAKAIGYVNAGTIEFLVDPEKNFYFLEMNTRLQVEHPVTEMITGIDLVAEQIQVAAGSLLSWTQEEIGLNGHALECRLYAEDPKTFIPSPGIVETLALPEGEYLRIDCGIRQGYQVTPFYDPLLAKVITWGNTREESLSRMADALNKIEIRGLKTNITLLKNILAHPNFKGGKITTDFIMNM